MAKDLLLKKIVVWSVIACVLVVGVVLYIHYETGARQLEREIIYRKAQTMALEQQRAKMRLYQRRAAERQRRQQYNQGRVVGMNTSSGW